MHLGAVAERGQRRGRRGGATRAPCAQSKYARSWYWQKYTVWNSSCSSMMRAPAAAARRTSASARACVRGVRSVRAAGGDEKRQRLRTELWGRAGAGARQRLQRRSAARRRRLRMAHRILLRIGTAGKLRAGDGDDAQRHATPAKPTVRSCRRRAGQRRRRLWERRRREGVSQLLRMGTAQLRFREYGRARTLFFSFCAAPAAAERPREKIR